MPDYLHKIEKYKQSQKEKQKRKTKLQANITPENKNAIINYLNARADLYVIPQRDSKEKKE